MKKQESPPNPPLVHIAPISRIGKIIIFIIAVILAVIIDYQYKKYIVKDVIKDAIEESKNKNN